MRRALNFVLCLGILCMGESVHGSASPAMKLFNSFAPLDEDAHDATCATPSAPSSSQAFHKPGRRAKGKGARGASSQTPPSASRLSPPDALHLAKLYVTQSAQKEGDLALLGKAISLVSQYADIGEKSPFNDVRARALLALGWRLNQGSVKRTTIDGREYTSSTCYTLAHVYAETFKKEGLLHEVLLGLVESTPRGALMLNGTSVNADALCIQVYEAAPKNSSLAVRALSALFSCAHQDTYLIKGKSCTIDDVFSLAVQVANRTQDREAAARCYWTMGQCIGGQHLTERSYLAKSDLFTLCARSTSAPIPKARAFLFAIEARLGERPEPGSLALQHLKEQAQEAHSLAASHHSKALLDDAKDLLGRIEALKASTVTRVPAHSFMRRSDPID